jgi:predicted dehydrogenase
MNENEVVQTNEEGVASRREFLSASATVAGLVAAAGAASAHSGVKTASATRPKPAPAASKAPATKLAGKIPVPVADAKGLKGGKFPMGTKLASMKVLGANSRINIGFVGVGGQGYNAHVRSYSAKVSDWNVMPIAACDVYQGNLDRAVNEIKNKAGNVNAVGDRDYRKLLEMADIDAIVIATPEHWHGQVAVHAIQAGKHVYCEKPMVRYLDEAFQLYDVAKSAKAVVQIGSQGCSDVRWHATAKAIREGKIGKLVMGQGSYCRNNRKGEWNYGIPGDLNPTTLEWERWLGSCPNRPFVSAGGARGDEFPERDDAGARWARYRKYWDYSAGILGDLMPHKLHPFLIASGNPEFPTRVMSIGTHGVQSKDREVADTVQVIAEFPSGWSMLFIGSTVNEQGLEDMIRGEKGTIRFGNAVRLNPERPYTEEVEPMEIDTNTDDLARFARYENIPSHQQNWLESIRKNDPMNCNANIELAIKVQAIISLAEMSQRLNKAMLFDPATRKVTAS